MVSRRRVSASRARASGRWRWWSVSAVLPALVTLGACGTPTPPDDTRVDAHAHAHAAPQSLNGCDRASAIELPAGDARVPFGGMFGFAYDPTCVVIDVGAELTFVGNFAQHPLKPGRIEGDTVVVAAGNPIHPTSAGSQATFTFTQPGSYGFFCDTHLHEQMMGAVFVGPPSIADGASAPVPVPTAAARTSTTSVSTAPLRAPDVPARAWDDRLPVADKATLAPNERLMRNVFLASPWEPERPAPTRPGAVMEVWEVTRYRPEVPPTPNQMAVAQSLVEAAFQAAETNRWFDFEVGLRDGFKTSANDPTHYSNLDFILDDVSLDPTRPEVLMYYETPTGNQLAGMMFLVRKRDEQGPQVSGHLTRWHYHLWPEPTCLMHGILMTQRAPCSDPNEVASHISPEMMHVWLVDHPDGTFATTMQIAPELLATLLDRRRAERGW